MELASMAAILKPIVLWTPTATLTSDEACTSIYQYQLAPAPSSIRAPYQTDHHHHLEPTTTRSLSYLPPLQYFCIKALIQWPDHVHALGPAQLRYQPPSNRHDFDLIQALIPTYRPFSPHHDHFDMRLIDPRLWAVLAQIFADLPPTFRAYSLPLSDIHLPLLQRIPNTSHFSLITVLSLSKCRHLTDDTVVELRELHTLAALDASVTSLGTWGVLRLAKTLSWSDGEDEPNEVPSRRGPWGLRVLYLNNCINVDNKVLPCLSRFPLLSVVDLRGTTCKPWLERNLLFSASSDARLYDPTNLTSVLAHLSSLADKPYTVFSSDTPYILRVDSLYHKTNTTHQGRLATNPWDPYGEYDDCELGIQVARGRMDVFLPLRPERYSRPSYSDLYPCEGEYELMENACRNPDELHSDEDENYVDTFREDSNPFDRSGSGSGSEHEEGHEDEDENEEEDEHEDDDGQPSGPWHMSDSHWGEGLAPSRVREEPQLEVPRSWMDAAEDEMRIHRDRAGADRFYGLLAPRRLSSTPSLVQVQTAKPSTSTTTNTKPKPPDRLMLFRIPPPWSSLPSRQPPPPQSRRSGMPTSVFASSSTATARHPPPKRRQPEDVAVTPADRGRKRMRPITSMQPIFSAMQKRFESAATGKGKEKEQVPTPSLPSGPAGRANPFARKPEATKSPLSDVLKRLQPSAPPPARLVEPARSSSSSSEHKVLVIPKSGSSTKPQADPPPSVDQEKAGRKGASKRPAPDPLPTPSTGAAPEAQTTDTAPPRPAKKMKPITSWPAPDWPNKPMKPLSEHKKMLKSAPPKAQKQTTLPAGKATAQTKTQRHVSAPTRLQLAPAKPEKGANCGTRKPQGKGTEKLARKPSAGGKGFDWKGWSAG